MMTIWDDELRVVMDKAQARYGDFASVHEALGVAMEEFDELRNAIHENNLPWVAHEAIDLAAVLLRLVECLDRGGKILDRSVK